MILDFSSFLNYFFFFFFNRYHDYHCFFQCSIKTNKRKIEALLDAFISPVNISDAQKIINKYYR